MTIKTKIAFWLYFVAAVNPGVFGIVYLFREKFMPYHSVVVGIPWSDVPGPFQVLILGLLKGAGGLMVTTSVALLVLLLLPFRHGARWAVWAVPSLALLGYAALANAAAHVTLNSSAMPPWGAITVGVACIIAGAALSIPNQSKASGV